MGQAQLSRMLQDAVRSVEGEVAHALSDRGSGDLTPAQARALLLVDRTGTRLTDLAQRAGVTKQAMMQMVDDLESLGHVRRARDPRDARAKVVRVTAKGLRARARARKALSGVEGRIRRRLGPRRYEALRAALEDLSGRQE